MTEPHTPTAEQERVGAAAALLSLDKVVPFYQPMGVPTLEPKRFVQVLRGCIIDNRREFERNPNRVPEIDKRIQGSLARTFDVPTAQAYDRWQKYFFVYSAQDFEAFSDWYMVLALSRNSGSRWNALGLPETLSEEARMRFEQVVDRTELHQIADQLEACPLSAWDLEIYTLHGFDDDDNDPYNWVLETIKKRRFVVYLIWLVKRLNNEERMVFSAQAEQAKHRIETIANSPALPDPLVVTEPYASNI